MEEDPCWDVVIRADEMMTPEIQGQTRTFTRKADNGRRGETVEPAWHMGEKIMFQAQAVLQKEDTICSKD